MLAELSQARESVSERSEHLSHSPKATGAVSWTRIPRLALVAVGGLLLRGPPRMTCWTGGSGIVVLVLHQFSPLVGGGVGVGRAVARRARRLCTAACCVRTRIGVL